MPNWQINALTYDSTPGVARVPIDGAPYFVNERRLAVATARSLLTITAPRPARQFAAAIVPSTMRFMLRWQNGPLRLRAAFLTGLRDFSNTSRLGELAQGAARVF